jgi:UPF0716 protein FxsA
VPVFLILLAAVAVEITVMVSVGAQIGVLSTIGLLVLATLVGGLLLRREGVRTLGALQQAVAAGRLPQREALDGVLIAAAGVLVILPGFVSDVLAILLLLPPTRALVRGLVVRRVERAVVRAQRRAGAIVVESVVVDTGDDHPRERRDDQPIIVIPSTRADTD